MGSVVAVPQTSKELREFLEDKGKVAEAMKTPSEAAAFIEKYTQKAYEHDPELKEQMATQLKDNWESMARENGYVPAKEQTTVSRPPMTEDAIDKILGTRKFVRKAWEPNPGALGAQLDGNFKSAGDFAQAIDSFVRRNTLDARLKDLSEEISGDGGFLVPEEYRAELLRVALETAVVRPRARVIPMGGETLRFPAILDTSHASSVYGGISGNWVAESADLSSSTNQPTFIQVRLDARKLTAYTVASNELLQDSAIAMESLITSLFPEAISFFEDDSFLNGTGAGQPLGIINADAMVSVTKVTGQSANTILYRNILDMYSRMLPSSINRAVWVAHPNVFPEIAEMALEVGTGGNGVWLANAAGGPPTSILGRPLIITEKAQTLGTAGDLSFVDFGYYLIGDRQAMTMMASPHVKFINDQMVWRLVQRVDGRPWITSAITPRNGTTTLSPFLNLASRS